MTTPLTPAGLRCAHQIDPLGVAPDRVSLSWLLAGTGHGRAQTSYQVVVTEERAGEVGGGPAVWDSGRVWSSDQADIGYQGHPLARGGRYTWRVRVWDEHHAVSQWSTPARFEVELDPADGWRASWIGLGPVREEFKPPSGSGPADPMRHALGPAPYLRRGFTVGQPVAWARLHVTALGLYEARLNGHRVGDAVLAPGWTDYTQRIAYQSYDVTPLIRAGENVLGALLADGWYAGFLGFDAKRAGAHYGRAPELLAQLIIGLADGTTQQVVTDEAWQATFAAIRHADLLMGERHEPAREPHGWDAPGFDQAGWRAVRVRDRDGRPLVADPGPPVRVTEEIRPVSVTADDAGRLIADFGQNLPGWLRVSTHGPGGATVRIRHAEVLAADGTLYTDNLRTARQTDEFCSTGGAATFEPRFTLHGFRYAELDGYPGQPGPDDIVARVAHSDIPATGSFESSESWLNQLFRNIDWGQRGNFISVPTDCPQRDERLGWLGDAQVFARTACYNRDVAAFFHKWLDDVADAQYPSGAFSDIAPRLNVPWAGAPAWGDAGVIVPWTLHKMYGDTAVLRRHFAAMTSWMDFVERDNPDYLRTRNLGNSYNDWLAPGDDETSPELLATAYWAYDAALMAEIADAAGYPEQAAGYRALRAKIGAAFADEFLAADGQLTSGTQTAYVLGLHMQLFPEELRAAAARHLVAAIRAADWHLSTGFAGVGYLLPVLSSTGHTDVAYRLLEQDSAPSWRYMVDHGATTIWERWDGWTEQRGFQSAWMNSFNHYALGSVGEWLYRFVLGIDQWPGHAGFGRLLIRPHPGGSLRAAHGSYRSVRGLIRSGWQRDGETLRVQVEIPPNASACIRVPSPDPESVRDGTGGHPAAVADYPGLPGVREAVFDVGSGSHEFAGPGAWAGLAAVIPARRLNSGYQIPLLGLGTYPMDGAAGAAAMAQAIAAGYRLLDTAAKYGNEWAVGEAIKRSGVDRRDLFVTSKLRGADHGRASTRDAVAASLDRLRLDYLDLYLIHWPLPRLGRYVESYQAMLELAAEGLIRSVGVSNFKPAHIAALIGATGVTPAVDQIELSPALPRQATVGYLARAGVLPQAWSPLGGGHQVTRSAVVTGIAQAHGITPAQAVLRWAVQQGIAVIPKSSDPQRQRANLDVFGFCLTAAEMAELATLDLGEAAAVDSDLRVEF